MTQIPLLQTNRLTLRPMTFADWPDYAACMQTERVHYMGGDRLASRQHGGFFAQITPNGIFSALAD